MIFFPSFDILHWIVLEVVNRVIVHLFKMEDLYSNFTVKELHDLCRKLEIPAFIIIIIYRRLVWRKQIVERIISLIFYKLPVVTR